MSEYELRAKPRVNLLNLVAAVAAVARCVHGVYTLLARMAGARAGGRRSFLV